MNKREGSMMGYLFSSNSSGNNNNSSKPDTTISTASPSSSTIIENNNSSSISADTTTNTNIQIPESPQSSTPRESINVSSAKQGGINMSPEENKKEKPKIKDRQSQRVMDIQLPEHIKLPPTSLPPLYFNIVLLNKQSAVEKTIKKKTGLKGGIFAKAMSAAANSVISDKAVIDKLSEQLKTNLENTVSEMGIVATVSKAFQQGNYIYIYTRDSFNQY